MVPRTPLVTYPGWSASENAEARDLFRRDERVHKSSLGLIDHGNLWQVVLAAVMGNPRFFEAKKYIEELRAVHAKAVTIERAIPALGRFCCITG